MKLLATFLLGLMFLGQAVSGQSVTLNFSSLPSAQGWFLYPDCYPSTPESSLFSVAGNNLHQDTTSCGPHAAEYEIDNVVTSTPFTITVRMRVTSDVLFASGDMNHLGIGFGAQVSGKAWYIGIGPGFVDAATATGNTVLSTSIDTTQFHTYVLHATPSTGAFTLSVDGTPSRLGHWSEL